MHQHKRGRTTKYSYDLVRKVGEEALKSGATLEAVATKYGLPLTDVKRMASVVKNFYTADPEFLNKFPLELLYQAARYALRYGQQAALEALASGKSTLWFRSQVDRMSTPMVMLKLPKPSYAFYLEAIDVWMRHYKELFGENPSEVRLFEAIMETARSLPGETIKRVLLALFEDGHNVEVAFMGADLEQAPS